MRIVVWMTVGCAVAGCAAEVPAVHAPAVVATHVVDVAPLVQPEAGEMSACPAGSHPVAELCVADGRPLPKFEPRGNGDPCASWGRPELGLQNCDPQNEGDPDMDHERGAILRTLSDTKVDVVKCKTPRGPRGAGHVEITFAASGAATSARVVGVPYEGTPTGACVATKFRAVKAPDFKKKPSITVEWTFVID